MFLFHAIDGAKGQNDLRDIVQFWTGYPGLPIGQTTIMHVKYLETSTTKVLAEASTCSLILSIPVVHDQYDTFKEHINKSVSFGKIGFGKI